MKEQLIKLAKGKGFKSSRFDVELTQHTELIYYFWMCELQKWLREKHNIHMVIHYNDLTEKYRVEYITNLVEDIFEGWSEYKTFEQALEKGLIESLKLIK